MVAVRASMLVIGAIMMAATGSTLLQAETVQKPEQWWQQDKPRVFVARSPSYQAGNLHDEHLQEIVDAGFNVLAHRWVRPVPDQIEHDEIERVIGLCQQYGLRYMSWMRGSVTEKPDHPDYALTWQDGTVQDVHGPLSPRLWEFLEQGLTYLARLSVDSACVGAFLDFENYAPNKRGNLYPVSYDRYSLILFAEDQGIEPPPAGLEPGRGAVWVAEQDLTDTYRQWQQEAFRARARALRLEIDRINPSFLVGVYVTEGMTRLFAGEMATSQAPVLFAPATTYGRASPLLPQAEALEANQAAVLRGIASTRQRHDHFIYLPGVMPRYRGADPEFTGKNIVAAASAADGYWLWIELRRDGNEEEWRDYMRWLTHANRDIARGRYQLHREPRQGLEFRDVKPPVRQTDLPQVGIYHSGRGSQAMADMLNQTGAFEAHLLEEFSAGYFRNFDMVVLQNFNVAFLAGSRVHQVLRDYVHAGGRLLIAHNTLRYLESPFPDIAVRDYPKFNVSSANQVLDRRMIVRESAPVFPSELLGKSYLAGFVDHIIHAPGSNGTVLVDNYFGEAVYVTGEHGAGRVAFSGCHFGYGGVFEGTEREVFLAVLDWLADGRRR